ncbi:MAG: 6-phosphofructokinase [Thermodesulfobacteriota bacterium]
MRAFMCHDSRDGEFVIQVASHLRKSLDHVFFFEDNKKQQDKDNYISVLQEEVRKHPLMVVFVGGELTDWQVMEIQANLQLYKTTARFHVVYIARSPEEKEIFRQTHNLVVPGIEISIDKPTPWAAAETAQKILRKLNVPWRSIDGLPLDPHLFSYEKDIIEFYKKRARGQNLQGPGKPNQAADDQEAAHGKGEADAGNGENWQDDQREHQKQVQDGQEEQAEMNRKLLDGCSIAWPEVERWEHILKDYHRKATPGTYRAEAYENQLRDFGKFRPLSNKVVASTLTMYHEPADAHPRSSGCLIRQGLCFPEAGPRQGLYFPPMVTDELKVAILVSGGIAPGINAVVDGIVQRHWLYACCHKQEKGLKIYGLRNGFQAFEAIQDSMKPLAANDDLKLKDALVTSAHASEGGSILGTSRVDELIQLETRLTKLEDIVNKLRVSQFDILYVIGGDGSMKAAHALWSVARNTPGRPLSVVAIPKTMDNDILWVWQSFGFLSAVEKAREVIEQLHTEVSSNPRLCILQLFGSDSGFVVSQAVLASPTGHCDVALIPEVDFSMTKLAKVIKKKMWKRRQRIPHGLIVLAETAIPTDATQYAAPEGQKPAIDIGLSRREQDEILRFHECRKQGKRIQGQTSDYLRTAGLKIVSQGLPLLLPETEIDRDDMFEPDWKKMRVFTNEPRHLLRAIPPSCSDIIFGQRLGILAVDNAMAGFTDFMISQWLTEYVLVPLKLVVLGRKRIPSTGMFWRSVLAKTGQPEDMVNP